MPPIHFCHKTFPGMSINIFHHAEFQHCGCLLSWLTRIWSFDLNFSDSTFSNSNSTFLNYDRTQTTYQADTSVVCSTILRCTGPVCGFLDISLVSWTHLWCPLYVWHPCHICCVTVTHLVPFRYVVSLTCLLCPQHFCGLCEMWCLWQIAALHKRNSPCESEKPNFSGEIENIFHKNPNFP